MNSNPRLKTSAKRCLMLLMLASMTIFTHFAVNGCNSAGSEIVYVNDSRRIAVLDVNEPAPFKGILITQGYFEYLLDLEGESQ